MPLRRDRRTLLASFARSMDRLHVLDPDHEPRATHFIPQIVVMIARLVERACLRRRRRRLFRGPHVSALRRALGTQRRRVVDRRAHRGGRRQTRSARLRTVEIRETGRAVVALAVGRRAPRLAYRVLRDGARAARRAVRHPRRRVRSDLPAPRERDRADRVARAAAMANVWMHGGLVAIRRKEDVEVARQFRAARDIARPARCRRRSGCSSCRPVIVNP